MSMTNSSDFKSDVGKRPEGKIVGAQRLRTRIVRGNIMVDVCKKHNLMVTGSWFKKEKIKLYTCKSPGDIDQYKIGYIVLVKDRFRNSVKNVRIFPGVDRDSGHNMLAAAMRTKLKHMHKRWNLKTNVEF